MFLYPGESFPAESTVSLTFLWINDFLSLSLSLSFSLSLSLLSDSSMVFQIKLFRARGDCSKRTRVELLRKQHPWTIKTFCRLSTADVAEMHRGTEKLRYLVEFRVEIFSMARRGSRVERSKRSCGEESGKLLRNRVKFFDKRCFIHRWSYPTWRWTAYTRSWYAEARGALSTIGWLYAEKALLHRRCAAFAIATEHHRYCHTPPYGSAAEWSPGWSALVSRWCWWSPPSCCGSEDQPFISSLYIFYFARYPSPSPFLLLSSFSFSSFLSSFLFFLVLSILSNSSQFDEKTKNGMAREFAKSLDTRCSCRDASTRHKPATGSCSLIQL